MFIEEVYLKDIFSHRESRIKFGRGLNVIIGPNGAGKSSIIDSIVYALLVYGPASEELVRTRKSEMIRVGARRGEIKILFSRGGHMYEVHRIVSSEGSSEDILRMIRPKQMVLALRSNVAKEIYKILEISDPKILTSTIIARQDYINEILLEPSSRRKERILRLIGLDKIEKAREKIREMIKEIDQRLKEVFKELGRKEQLEKDLSNYRGVLKEREERYYKLSSEVEKLRKTLEDLQMRRDEAQKIFGELMIIREYNDLMKKKADLEKLNNRLSKYNTERINSLRKIRDEIKSLYKEKDRYSNEFKKVFEEIQRIKKEYISHVKKILELVDDKDLINIIMRLLDEDRFVDIIERLKDYINKILGEISYLQALRDMLSSFIRNFRESDRCPICGSPLNKERREEILRHHEEELNRIFAREKILQDRKNILEKTLSTLEMILRSYELNKRRLSDLEMNLMNIDKDLLEKNVLCKDLIKDLVDIDVNCVEKIDEIIEDYEKTFAEKKILESDIYRLEKDLERYKGSIDEFRRHVADFLIRSGFKDHVNKDPVELTDLFNDIINKMYREIEAVKKDYEPKNSDLNRLEGEINRLRDVIKDIEEKLQKLRSIEEEKNRLEKIREIFDKLTDLMKRDGVIVRKMTYMLREALEKEINDILSEIGRSFRVSVDDEFDINIIYGTDLVRPVDNLSGGEKTMLSIAMRLALAKVLTGRIPRFMILDEPTQNLDKDMRVMIFDIIKTISGGMDQVIVVTHDEDIIEKADHVIKVVNDGGISRVSSD